MLINGSISGESWNLVVLNQTNESVRCNC